MHITRQVAMTILPSTTSATIARLLLLDVLDQGLSFTGESGRELANDIFTAESQRGGFKNFAIDVLSLPTRLIVGVDQQAKNVPPYHQGYFFSCAPKPLPGVMQAGVAMTRGLASVAGYGAGAVGSLLGTLVGKVAQHLGSTQAPADVAASYSATGAAIGRAPFAAFAWVIELLPKAHRKLLNALIA